MGMLGRGVSVTYDQTPKPDWELSRDELAERYQRVHLWAMKKFVHPSIRLQNDWESELFHLIAICIIHYKPERKTKFLTFYHRSARNAVQQFLEARQKRFDSRMANFAQEDGDRDFFAQLCSTPSRHEDEVADREEFDRILKKLTPNEKESVLRELGFTTEPLCYKVGPNKGKPLTQSEATKRYNQAIYEVQRRLGLRPKRVDNSRVRAEAKRRAEVAARQAERARRKKEQAK